MHPQEEALERMNLGRSLEEDDYHKKRQGKNDGDRVIPRRRCGLTTVKRPHLVKDRCRTIELTKAHNAN
jgi:hypothetical protein